MDTNHYSRDSPSESVHTTPSESVIVLKKGCNKTWKHMGEDYMAPVGKDVYFHRSGVVKKIAEDKSGWKWYVVMESNWTTFTIHHLKERPWWLEEGKYYDAGQGEGIYLGQVADLSKKGSPSHIHIGQRSCRYDGSKVATAGALPACDHKKENDGYPKAPEKFKAPDRDLFHFGNN